MTVAERGSRRSIRETERTAAAAGATGMARSGWRAIRRSGVVTPRLVRKIENLAVAGDRPGRATAGRTAGPPARHTERGGRRPIARVYVRRACAAFPAGGSSGGLVTCWKTPHTGHPPGAA